MIDLGNPQHRSRLFTAIKASRDALAPFCRNRRDMIEEFAGPLYGKDEEALPAIVNLFNQAAKGCTTLLASNCPRVQLVTEFPQLRAFSRRYQIALNNFIQEMHVEQTFNQIALDAFFSIGIAKVYRRDWAYIELEPDIWIDPGKPYVGRVSLDDFFMDMSVTDVRRAKFMGDSYRVSWDKVRHEPAFDRQVVAGLNPTSRRQRENQWEGAQDITGRNLDDSAECEDMIDLQDVWLSERNEIATFARDTETPPLLVRPSVHESGPFHLLCLADVPDNTMPVAPAQNLKMLHDLFNSIFRKLARQAKRHKVVHGYRGGAEEDVKRRKKAGDGDFIKMTDPAGIVRVEDGGIAPANVAFVGSLAQLFDRMAGNLQAMLGLSAQAGTLGQEQLIYGAASRLGAEWLHRTNDFASEVLKHVGRLMWMDGLLEVPGQVEHHPGTGVMVDMSWNPKDREGDFWQYNFRVEPFSMNYQPPEAKFRRIQEVVPIILQVLQAQAAGAPIDAAYFVELASETNNLPELKHLYSEMFRGEKPVGEEAPNFQINQPREYIRRNVSMGRTPLAQADQFQESMIRMAGQTGVGAGTGT